jgi:hypothetical protein
MRVTEEYGRILIDSEGMFEYLSLYNKQIIYYNVAHDIQSTDIFQGIG